MDIHSPIIMKDLLLKKKRIFIAIQIGFCCEYKNATH